MVTVPFVAIAIVVIIIIFAALLYYMKELELSRE